MIAGGHPGDVGDADAGIQPECAQHVGAAWLAAAGRAALRGRAGDQRLPPARPLEGACTVPLCCPLLAPELCLYLCHFTYRA